MTQNGAQPETIKLILNSSSKPYEQGLRKDFLCR